jgi:hypothetical protein
MNRAAARHKRGHYDRAVEDAGRAISLDGTNIKCWHRKAQALIAQGKFTLALEAYQEALLVEPTSRWLAKQIDSAQKAVDSTSGRNYKGALGYNAWSSKAQGDASDYTPVSVSVPVSVSDMDRETKGTDDPPSSPLSSSPPSTSSAAEAEGKAAEEAAGGGASAGPTAGATATAAVTAVTAVTDVAAVTDVTAVGTATSGAASSSPGEVALDTMAEISSYAFEDGKQTVKVHISFPEATEGALGECAITCEYGLKSFDLRICNLRCKEAGEDDHGNNHPPLRHYRLYAAELWGEVIEKRSKILVKSGNRLVLSLRKASTDTMRPWEKLRR